jgi:HPt (histidine-containing phosphotransfer) domain-containing protein
MPNARPTSATPSQPAELISTLASDPDMGELIKMFVDEIPDRVRLVQEHWQHRNFEELKRVAHQLKGACGGYGFPTVGRAAGVLEAELNGKTTPSQGDLDCISRQVNELVDLCRRVRVTEHRS